MYDVIVVGGGMVGAATALGLARQNKRVAVIENSLPTAFDAAQPPDIRVSALSLSSVALLQQLDAWSRIQAMRCKAYDQLSVWEGSNQSTARTDFTAASVGQQHLGYFVENRLTQLALHEALQQFNKVDWITDAEVAALDSNKAELTLTNGQVLKADWIVGAEGARSQVRQMASINQTGWQYGQQALGITIAFEQDSGHHTWQQFRPNGPVALLPMYDNIAALIWYDDAAQIKRLASLSDTQLYHSIIANFPDTLPAEFTIRQRAAFPISRNHAHQYVKERVILIGDAAHTINPLAGQGVNIGFKDVEALLNVFAEHQRVNVEVLRQAYEKPRMRHNALMMTAMDLIYVTFSNDITPMKWLRSAGLTVAQHAGPLKQQALKYAMGM